MGAFSLPKHFSKLLPIDIYSSVNCRMKMKRKLQMSTYNEKSLSEAKFGTGFAPQVTQRMIFVKGADKSAPKLPEVDEATGLFIFIVTGEVIVDGRPDASQVKVLAKEAPVVAPSTAYRLIGLQQTPFINQDTNRLVISYKASGLEVLKASAPSFPNKD
jgi:hypothetical protein